MKVLENGDYLLDDGTVVPADEIGRLYEKNPVPASAEDNDNPLNLSEGQCSGPICLED